VKWEYQVKFYESAGGIVFSPELQRYLNEMGGQGWELVQCDYEEYQMIFKRRVEANEKLRQAQLKENSENGSSEIAQDVSGEGL